MIDEIFDQMVFILAIFAFGLSLLIFMKTFQKEILSIRLKRLALYLVLILFAIVFLLPIWVAFMTSLKNDTEVDKSNPLLPPTSPTSNAYSKALGVLGRPMINSLMFTVGAVLLSVLLGSILGYIFSKFKFRYHNLVFLIIVAGTFLPYTTIVYALVRLISGLHLYTTIPGLILTHTAYGIPVCAFMFRNFYADIPQSTIDKARKRGDGDWRIYRRIILPASGTAIITVVMFQFTSIWNDFLFGLFLGGGPTQAEPATVALAGLAGSHTNLLMAGAMLVFLPVFLLYVFMGRYFVRYLSGPSEAPEKEIEPTPELE
jgi:glucose/mannose transport system permease protein